MATWCWAADVNNVWISNSLLINYLLVPFFLNIYCLLLTKIFFYNAKTETFLISALMLMNGDGQEQVATAAEAGQTRQQATDESPTPMATHPTTHPQEHPSKWMGTRKLLRWVAKCQLSGGKSRPLGMGLRVGMAPRTGQWICRMGKTICPGGLAVTCRRNFSLRRALEKRSHLKSMISHILQNRISIFFDFPIFIFLSEASILIKMNLQICYKKSILACTYFKFDQLINITRTSTRFNVLNVKKGRVHTKKILVILVN